jgi:hypothetical protein
MRKKMEDSTTQRVMTPMAAGLLFGGLSKWYTPFGDGIVGPLRSIDILEKIQPLCRQTSQSWSSTKERRVEGLEDLRMRR